MAKFHTFAAKQNVMNNIKYNQIALLKTKELGYDTVRYVGERNGWVYYRLAKTSLIGKKCGLPQYIKISRNGDIIVSVKDLQEEMWAIRQENTLYNL